MNLSRTVLPCILAASLSACGGGGDSSSPALAMTAPATTTPTTPTAIANSGSVSAAYVKAASARYVLLGIGSQSTGALSSATQDSAGVMTAIAGNALTGSPTATKEINGNANYAQGRWFVGTVTQANISPQKLDGSNNDSFHYVVLNNLATIPTTGSKTCDAGRFTAPSYVGGTGVPSAGYFGTTTGSATLSFDGSGAHPGMVLNATSNSSSGSVTVSGTVATPSSSAVSGAFFGNGAGGMIMVADGGAGTVIVVGGYRAVLANGSTYQGIASFRCS